MGKDRTSSTQECQIGGGNILVSRRVTKVKHLKICIGSLKIIQLKSGKSFSKPNLHDVGFHVNLIFRGGSSKVGFISPGIEDSTKPILILEGSFVLMGKCGETHHGSMIFPDDFCETMLT